MFFDPTDVIRIKGGHRKARPQYPPVRFLILFFLLLISLLDSVSWLAQTFLAELSFWKTNPYWVLVVTVSAWVISALILSRISIMVIFRGIPHILIGAIIAGIGGWFASNDYAGHNITNLLESADSKLDFPWIAPLITFLEMAICLIWFFLFGWWLFGKTMGWGGHLGFPLHTWADPLLGNECRLNRPANLIVGYVVYHDWSIFEEIISENMPDAFTIPLRSQLLSEEIVISDLEGVNELEWTPFFRGRIFVLSLFPHSIIRIDQAPQAATTFLSLVDPEFDGFSCSPKEKSAMTIPVRQIDLYQASILRRSPDERLIQMRRPHIPLDVVAPTCQYFAQRADSQVTINIGLQNGKGVLDAVLIAGFRVAPLAPRLLNTLSDKFLELISPKKSCGLIEIDEPIGTNEFNVVLEQLSQTTLNFSEWKGQLTGSNPPEYLPYLQKWHTFICEPAGILAKAYLRWAEDSTASLPEGLRFDPYSGSVENDFGRLLDFGVKLVINQKTDSDLTILPVPQGPLNEFFFCLEHLSNLVELSCKSYRLPE